MTKRHKKTLEIIIHPSELLEFITQAERSSYTVESFQPHSKIIENDGEEKVLNYEIILSRYEDKLDFIE